MKGFLSVLVGLLLALCVIAAANFLFHVPEGAGRGGVFALAALVFLVCAFGPGRLWGKSLNDRR